MALKFFNIRSGETLTAEGEFAEPQISALWASSDHSPNITQGQDMGWRLAPAVVVQLKQIKQDPVILTQLAARLNKPTDDITDPDILLYISASTEADNAPVATYVDYVDAYDEEIKRETAKAIAAKKAASQDVSQIGAPTETLEDLEKRVKLEERLAKARASKPEAETTTTTTTEENPTTTITTTQVK